VIATNFTATSTRTPNPGRLDGKVHFSPTLLRVGIQVAPMQQIVTDMPCVQVVDIVCDALVAFANLKPTLCKFINFPLEVEYLFIPEVLSD
jgi:hypothetical protein